MTDDRRLDVDDVLGVIRFFDEALARFPEPERLAEATAWHFGGRAGIDHAEEPAGRPGPRPAGCQQRALPDGGIVWRWRDTEWTARDELVLDRLAAAVTLLRRADRAASPEADDPALMELALSAAEPDVARARALRLLGINPASTARVVAYRGDCEDADRRILRLGSVRIYLGTDDWAPAASPACMVGISGQRPALYAPTSLREARVALRFCAADHPLTRAEWLGAMALLADVPAELLHASEDVRALDVIAAEPSGEIVLSALLAYCRTTSVRQAAAMIHRHHSTLPARIEHAADVLGFSLDQAYGKFRLYSALIARHLRDHPDEFLIRGLPPACSYSGNPAAPLANC
jgi:hypothetical protein